MRPVVSIVTATRNRPSEFARAYASVAAQTFGDWEWVVVDDHSDTAYAAALSETDVRVRVIEAGEATGKGPVRNLGLSAVSGTWFTFLDDDDELLPESLETLLVAAERHGFTEQIYRGNLIVEEADGRRRPPWTRVQVRRDARGRGSFAIHFGSDEEFNRILDQLRGE